MQKRYYMPDETDGKQKIGTFLKEFAGYTTKRSESDKAMQRKIMNIIGIKFRETDMRWKERVQV